MDPVVDIAFDCLPIRSIGRVDIPLDASPEFRARGERLQRTIESHAGKNAYFLYNTQCIYRLANSEIDNVLRFTFDGTVLTDLGDCKAERAELEIILASETCGGVPPAALEWLRGVVERAVLVEFDRFISAGQLAARVAELGAVENAGTLCGFAGMGL
ncbi:MAG TPA: hypothetical protein VHU84_03250 [Lacipirellulaceae bacterium]|nr:hypothetical protein [Lacipirellulaceae bacterium]